MSSARAETVGTVVVGAGPAGLAVGAELRRRGLDDFVLLERGDDVGAAWRRHYDRLCLHTDRANSELPGLSFPEDVPRYPTREQVIEYLERYAERFALRPRSGQNVTAVRRSDGGWRTETDDAAHESQNVVIATGYNRRPHRPDWAGLETFTGPVLHSSEYRNGAPYRGQRVLVVGFGNSGAEIALDLAEHEAEPCVSVRSPVNIVPRDLFGLPVLAIAIPLSRLPPRLADLLTRPIGRWLVGGLGPTGLRRSAEGPFTQIRRRARIPVVDVGTVALIRRGRIGVRPAIRRFTADGVVFEDGRDEGFDAVVLATGYRPAIGAFLEDADELLDEDGAPPASGRELQPGLYFCGFEVTPAGMLREIGIEAKRIGRAIARGSSRDAGSRSPTGASG